MLQAVQNLLEKLSKWSNVYAKADEHGPKWLGGISFH